MTLSLNVLNHLGINLYSNVSAVLSEVVANSYDADATRVDITVDQTSEQIVISDDGAGMDADEVNDRFLRVGYRRRDDGGALTPRFGRPVMGRKGIGKLSLFSVAEVVEVYTIKYGNRSAFRMDLADIRKMIGEDAGGGVYYPTPLKDFPRDLESGTRIVLNRLKKRTTNLVSGLRKRLARRFSIIGSRHQFQVFVGGIEVRAEDRDYFHKVQFLWAYGHNNDSLEIKQRCKNLDSAKLLPAGETSWGPITGWIAAADSPTSLKDPDGEDNLAKITLVVRGKVAHEDLLKEVSESSFFRSYLFGEVRADFLDNNDEEDIATSSRQGIIEDDPRYRGVIDWLRAEIRKIGSEWSDLRNKEGTKAALENEKIKEWFGTLGRDSKKKAERLFGKINQLTVDNKNEREELFAHAVLAFEVMRHKDNLDALDGLNANEIQVIGKVFDEIEDLESVLYHRIVKQRLKVIEKLDQYVQEDALEKVLQEHIFEHLWLLDPSWERATDRVMEERVANSFKQIIDKLPEEERNTRIDIRYKRITGAHVIVELKKHSVRTDSPSLISQIQKYSRALKKYLRDNNIEEPVECICIVGKDLKDWATAEEKMESQRMFSAINARVLKYDELLTNARDSYREYLNNDEKVGRIQEILDSIGGDS
ncbi:ATP-binding protein [Amycolatopsis sp. NPDC021455]|uniref:BbrUII/HgiDII family restriction enzyme n=1 Tax=Amycolatopsis sp. NPDC021455 TaxID=3154901 RepID=UPI00340D0AFD